MYNLFEYSDNYSDSTASLHQFKRQEQSCDNNDPQNINDLTNLIIHLHLNTSLD